MKKDKTIRRKYYILVKDGKIIKADRDYNTKIEHLPDGDVVHNTVADVRATYKNIDESKTYINNHLGGCNEVLYLYTE